MGVQDGGVVATAELPAEGRKRGVGELAGQIHGDLARPSDARGAAAREQLLERDVEGRAAGKLNVTDRAATVARAGVEALEDLGGELGRQRTLGEGVIGD